MKEEIISARKNLEETLRKITGFSIFVPEAKFFSMVCGCVGFASDLRGLLLASVEVSNDNIKNLLEDIANSLSIKPDIIYARKLPGSEEIVGLTARELCSRCKKEFSGDKPRPDIFVIKKVEER
ncbi:MAG: hypothetical protein EF806_00785 [Candidatus Methanoliparum thermophilum]|uniref:Uncharacterized protein n=1 Tax=Methanoliparum thermophilum TaxID=2491083 RepID=A0A520KTU2_METT2|nr:DUF5402 family protein [Candidatus Methanoliparum sp. LAM-1]RZN65460.1 MAG: hypothetical protein EF806_00785 [Candidatus Methanoliparum thermophilum]BDC35450.1 hypothetical protein MTLP_01320 [Candidatus Methanoliparum sp. LAM-1]